MKKRLFALCLCLGFVWMLGGCSNQSDDTNTKEPGTTDPGAKVEGELADIMAKLYEGIKEDEMPMYVENQPITTENVQGYIGTSDIEWEEAIASESMVGSTPHSVVLIRMKDSATASDIEAAKEKIKSSADPRKWICVEAEHVYVESKGNLIVLIMSNDIADTIKANFEQLS
ncbi:MAG: hypothetical protein HFE68_06530 [Erysipelotrichaceae bacterium]|nr:hypothetical protein [Erysipelotrichaceae bacterium]MCI9313003.1 hypothetical protein [Erysipelotrichaceae bacterium]